MPSNDYFKGFAQPYFDNSTWSNRLQQWLSSNNGAFANANEECIRKILNDPNTTMRVVVNIRAAALLAFLDSRKYLNAYELVTEIGHKPPDHLRLRADARVGVDHNDYFGALTLGGPGVRYYGEYCMVLRQDITDDNTRLFDRDSYDTLFEPLQNASNEEIQRLRGNWNDDAEAMLLLRVLPKIDHTRQIVTSGTVIELALTDQEFIEVHLGSSFSPEDIAQIVEAPEIVAMEARLRDRDRENLCSPHEEEWLRRRSIVSRRLGEEQIPYRVVTSHGRGYQWK